MLNMNSGVVENNHRDICRGDAGENIDESGIRRNKHGSFVPRRRRNVEMKREMGSESNAEKKREEINNISSASGKHLMPE